MIKILLHQNTFLWISSLFLVSSLMVTVCFGANTALISANSTNENGNKESGFSSISANGRFITFSSYATNLVAKDTKNNRQIYLRDLLTGSIKLVSVNSSGQAGNADSWNAVVSANGKFVAFTSNATNLIGGDTNKVPDIFVSDVENKEITRISVSSLGQQSNLDSDSSSISADGQYVAFDSWASNLVSNDTNNQRDIFVHNRENKTTVRVSVDSSGQQVAGYSEEPSINADGRYVAFMSKGETLISEDTNGRPDIFVYDLQLGTIKRVSLDSNGLEANNWSRAAAINADGKLIAFTSKAKMTSDDSNGTWDAFVHDISIGKTSRVSVNTLGLGADSYTTEVAISADGSTIAFSSPSTNLIDNDLNNLSDIFVHTLANKKTSRISVNNSGLEGNGVSESPALSADGNMVTYTSLATNLIANDANNVQDVFVRDRLINKNKMADIAINVSNKPVSLPKDQVGFYIFKITNNSENPVDGLTLVNVISGGKILSLGPSQGSCKKAAVSVCRIGTLGGGANVTLATSIKANNKDFSQQLSIRAVARDLKPVNNFLEVKTPIIP